MIQRTLLALFALTSVVLGYIAWQKTGDHAALRQQNEQLNTEREKALASSKKAAAEKDDAESNAQRLKEERDRARKEKAKVAATPGNTSEGEVGSPSKEETGPEAFLASMAKMMNSEEGKRMMRSQALTGVRKQYGDLARKMNLSPQDTDLLYALLADRDVAGSEDGLYLLSGGEVNEAALLKAKEKEKSLKADYGKKLKSMLGDRYAQFEEFERTNEQRQKFAQYDEVFTSMNTPLNQGQRDSLMQIMEEERKRVPAAHGAVDEDTMETLALLGDDSAIEKWAAREEDYQRRVLQAAPRTLNPDQVSALQQGFAQQIDEQKMAIKMGRELFKGINQKTAPAAK